MTTFMAVLFGAILSGITEVSKKFNVSQTNILLLGTLIIATVYTAIQWYNPDFLDSAIQFGFASLGVASGIYMFIQKYLQNKN